MKKLAIASTSSSTKIINIMDTTERERVKEGHTVSKLQ